MRFVRLIIYPSCAVVLGAQSLSLYLPDLVAPLMAALAGVAVAVAALVMLVWLAIRPSMAKLKWAAPALAAAALTVALVPYASRAAWPLYFRPRQAEAERFVADLINYRLIHEMSDGQRYHKSLNGTVFDHSHAVMTSLQFPGLGPVLERDHIDARRYDDFRRRLVGLGFIELEVTDTYVALVKDGLLDNLYGVLWLRPGAALPRPGSRVCQTDLVSLRQLTGPWYLFGTT